MRKVVPHEVRDVCEIVVVAGPTKRPPFLEHLAQILSLERFTLLKCSLASKILGREAAPTMLWQFLFLRLIGHSLPSHHPPRDGAARSSSSSRSP